MDDLCRSRNIVAFVIGGNCANQAFFKEDTAVLSPGAIAVLQAYELCTARWLATRHVDQEHQPLKERIHLIEVRLHCLVLPLKLRFRAYCKHSVP